MLKVYSSGVGFPKRKAVIPTLEMEALLRSAQPLIGESKAGNPMCPQRSLVGDNSFTLFCCTTQKQKVRLMYCSHRPSLVEISPVTLTPSPPLKSDTPTELCEVGFAKATRGGEPAPRSAWS